MAGFGNGDGRTPGIRRGTRLNGGSRSNGGARSSNGSATAMSLGARNGKALALAALGSVDYTLAKRALIREFRTGLTSQLDICDAHPELLRAARHVGEPASKDCPVCRRPELRLLAYVYADDLKADNGRVWDLHQGLALAASHAGGCCYVVEVCTWCSWNHLSRAFRARSVG